MVRVVDQPIGASTVRLDHLLAETRTRFSNAGVPEPAQDARVLVTGLLNLSPTDLIARGDSVLDARSISLIEDAVRQRLEGRPVYRILGWREFYGRRFALSPETLEPRPDTETLVEVTLDVARRIINQKQVCRIADLGVGTGAVGLSILAELPECTCLGVDIAPGALETARANADALGVSERYELQSGDWLEGIDAIFDIIVSNPPYIERNDVANLAREVGEHDPVIALDGGADGLDAYRAIAAQAGPRLSENGTILMEIGIGQGPDIAKIFNRFDFGQTVAARDLAGIERVIGFEKAEKSPF